MPTNNSFQIIVLNNGFWTLFDNTLVVKRTYNINKGYGKISKSATQTFARIVFIINFFFFLNHRNRNIRKV